MDCFIRIPYVILSDPATYEQLIEIITFLVSFGRMGYRLKGYSLYVTGVYIISLRVYTDVCSSAACHSSNDFPSQVAKLTIFTLSINKINFDYLKYEPQDNLNVFNIIKLKTFHNEKSVAFMLCVS